MKSACFTVLVASFALGFGAVDSAFAQSGVDVPGVKVTCFRQSGGTAYVGAAIQKGMAREADNRAQTRAMIAKSNRKGKDPLSYVWGVVPRDLRMGFNNRDWGEVYMMIERVDFYDRAECVNGDFFFSSPNEVVAWYIERANRRTKADPKTRVNGNWKEHVIRFKP